MKRLGGLANPWLQSLKNPTQREPQEQRNVRLRLSSPAVDFSSTHRFVRAPGLPAVVIKQEDEGELAPASTGAVLGQQLEDVKVGAHDVPDVNDAREASQKSSIAVTEPEFSNHEASFPECSVQAVCRAMEHQTVEVCSLHTCLQDVQSSEQQPVRVVGDFSGEGARLPDKAEHGLHEDVLENCQGHQQQGSLHGQLEHGLHDANLLDGGTCQGQQQASCGLHGDAPRSSMAAGMENIYQESPSTALIAAAGKSVPTTLLIVTLDHVPGSSAAVIHPTNQQELQQHQEEQEQQRDGSSTRNITCFEFRRKQHGPKPPFITTGRWHPEKLSRTLAMQSLPPPDPNYQKFRKLGKDSRAPVPRAFVEEHFSNATFPLRVTLAIYVNGIMVVPATDGTFIHRSTRQSFYIPGIRRLLGYPVTKEMYSAGLEMEAQSLRLNVLIPSEEQQQSSNNSNSKMGIYKTWTTLQDVKELQQQQQQQ